MNTSLVSDVLRLPDMEKVNLIQQLLESLKSPSISSISETTKIELEKRLTEFEANPNSSYSWDEVKSHIANKTWNTL